MFDSIYLKHLDLKTVEQRLHGSGAIGVDKIVEQVKAIGSTHQLWAFTTKNPVTKID